MIYQRHFSEPTLTVISINIEGISSCKEQLLQDLCQNKKCDVLCIQETHRDTHQRRPRIPGMKLVAERPHAQYGSAIFVKPELHVDSVYQTDDNNIEIISLELSNSIVTSIYKPPAADFYFNPPQNFYNCNKASIIIGDFNSRSHIWGYSKEDKNGEAVLSWAETYKLSLIHDNKLPPSFNSGRWQRGYNPDLLFVSETMVQQCSKSVCPPIPNTQHKPIMCQFLPIIRPQEVHFKRRYNFKKADWTKFSNLLDEKVRSLDPLPENYDSFVDLVQTCSRASIPRGCRTNYLPGITSNTSTLLDEYYKLHQQNPFGEETSRVAQSIIASISEAKREQWVNLLSECNMNRSSQKAWRLLRRLGNDPTQTNTQASIKADQIAHQLLLNGKPGNSSRIRKKPLTRQPELESNNLSQPFTLLELQKALNKFKNGKAAGLDDIRVEQIKNFGPTTMLWVLQLMNNCVQSLKIPKVWRKAKVIASLKPGKDKNDPRSYRPISLLCHLYKLLERLILQRMMDKIEPYLIPQQAGFREGKSCTSQVLNMTQQIEDGFERRKITGAVFIDLSAAYDTVKHNLLVAKLYEITHDYQLTCMIRNLLQNRRFFVEFQGKRSRWRLQKNGLPQGSVLAPALFNIYTNDQPLPKGTQSFIYADDLALTAQADSFEEIEMTLTSALKDLTTYYRNNQLKPNPAKTQTCAFHLKSKQAARYLNIKWEGIKLAHCETPKYLGVTLDRTLSYRKHCLNTKNKVAARNNVVRKLTGTSWGAQPDTVRTSALALCYSAAEYACPVWSRSCHTKEVDVAINETCRIITGCLRPTPREKLYYLAGIAPPDIRREVAARKEKTTSLNSPAHPLYGLQPAPSRLRSRRSFLKTTQELEGTQQHARLTLWRARAEHSGDWKTPREELPPGRTEYWTTWRSLNRLRSGVTRCKTNLLKWGYLEDSVLCDCGEVQNTSHLLECHLCPVTCTEKELLEATRNALNVAKFWCTTV